MKSFLSLLCVLLTIIGTTQFLSAQQKASDTAIQVGSMIPPGAIMPYAGSSAPSGWVLAYGQEVSQTGTYAKLYAAIGSTYCTTDHGGTCTGGNFRIPDLRGRFLGGKDNMGGSAASRITSAKSIDGTILGKSGGSQSFTPAGSVLGHYHSRATGGTLSLTANASPSGHNHWMRHNHQWAYHGQNDALYMNDGNSYDTASFTTGSTRRWQFTTNYNSGGSYWGLNMGAPEGGITSRAWITSGVYTSLNGTTGSSATTSNEGATAVTLNTGTIGKTSGGCDGDTSGSCSITGTEASSISPTTIVNYIIKI